MTEECHKVANAIHKAAQEKQLCPDFVDNLSGKGASVDIRRNGVWTRFAVTDDAEVFLMRYDMKDNENNEVKSVSLEQVTAILDDICSRN